MSTAVETILVIGATSSLAQSLCRTLAKAGHTLVLAARDETELELLSGDITARYGTQCKTIHADVMAPDFTPDLLLEQAGAFNAMVIACGDMGSENPMDLANLPYTMHVNYTVAAELATLAAQQLVGKKNGQIVLISSVAGDRGRQSNYAYGAAKAALTTFASGLRNRFYPLGVHVMTVKPGFVDTPMTWGMTSPLIASREYVAEKIAAAMEKKKNVVYVPWFWRYIMLIIQHIPEMIFKRLAL